MMTMNVDNSQDVIDSRDVIKRIEELETARAEHAAATGPFRPTDLGGGTSAAERIADESGPRIDWRGWSSEYADTLDGCYYRVQPAPVERTDR